LAALIGSIISFVVFGVVLKLAGVRGWSPEPIAFVNYLFAALLSGVLLLREPESAGPPILWLIGGAAGLCFVAGFFVNFRAIGLAGLSVAQPVASVAVMIPILASVLFWGERPTFAQMSALVLAGMALILLGSGGSEAHGMAEDQHDSGEPLPGGGPGVWGSLVALFLVQGLVMLAPKVVEEAGLSDYRWGYPFSLFLAAAMASGILWKRSTHPITVPALGLGIVFGAANLAATILLLVALESLPGILVYPVNSVGTMVLGALLGMILFSERPGQRAMLGIVLAVPSVFLLNL